jgi:hypothetical protein
MFRLFNKKRYFFVSFNWTKHLEKGIGNIAFQVDQFPSCDEITEELKTKYNYHSIVIKNIYEFKNKKDYVRYCANV